MGFFSPKSDTPATLKWVLWTLIYLVKSIKADLNAASIETKETDLLLEGLKNAERI